MISGVVEKDTLTRTRSKFMLDVWAKPGVVETAKDPELFVVGMFSKEPKVGRGEVESGGG